MKQDLILKDLESWFLIPLFLLSLSVSYGMVVLFFSLMCMLYR